MIVEGDFRLKWIVLDILLGQEGEVRQDVALVWNVIGIRSERGRTLADDLARRRIVHGHRRRQNGSLRGVLAYGIRTVHALSKIMFHGAHFGDTLEIPPEVVTQPRYPGTVVAQEIAI